MRREAAVTHAEQRIFSMASKARSGRRARNGAADWEIHGHKAFKQSKYTEQFRIHLYYGL